MKLDRYDKSILDALQKNGRVSNVQLASLVNLSESACLRRVRALEESGIIDRYAALVSQPRVGLSGNVFVLPDESWSASSADGQIQDNQWAISTRTQGKTFYTLSGKKADEFCGVPIHYIDGRDVTVAYAAVGEVVRQMREDRQLLSRVECDFDVVEGVTDDLLANRADCGLD